MSYVDDIRIREKYSPGFSREGNDIEIIVIHAAMGSAKGIIEWMLSGAPMPDGSSRAADYYKAIGMFHFINDRDGTIHRVIDEKNAVWGSQAKGDERKIIAIENGKLRNDNSDPLTGEQYQSLASFIYALRIQYPTINRIRTHDFYRRKIGVHPKPCPGTFDWKLFLGKLALLGINAVQHEDGDYSI